ncbi:MAG TPA: DUF2804 domain-containing protein [Acidimicrobiales bacterium]|jgi:hypothetical protein|nr:DUF2804 domain-containing protein [Acidimicrobiales bacterium]HRA35155.1 DUF2804 domain-containing protein [Acidimicrobiales bacterium]
MSPASSTPSATTGGAPPTVATTEEREITEAVDLCMPDGKHLNPAAKGWSRRPLHTANLRGGWGRTKRWDYWAVLAGDLVVSITYADVDYLGLADLWWVDLATGETGGRPAPLPLGRGVFLPNRPGTWPLRHHVAGYRLDIVDEPAADGRPAATVITAEWTEHGRAGHLHVRIDQPAGHESLNVVIPWSSTAFQYTSKHQARPAHGTFSIGGRTRRIGGDGGDGADGEADGGEAWGVLDVGRGRWPYRTRWNWGGGAGTATDGETVVGIQIGGKWTEGTGHTENGMIVDGRLHKIGQELTWTYSWDDPLAPWRVSLPDGTVDLTLTPRHDKHSATNALVLATEVHQVFGTWSGHVTTDVGRRVEVDGIQGFAEESRSRW